MKTELQFRVHLQLFPLRHVMSKQLFDKTHAAAVWWRSMQVTALGCKCFLDLPGSICRQSMESHGDVEAPCRKQLAGGQGQEQGQRGERELLDVGNVRKKKKKSGNWFSGGEHRRVQQTEREAGISFQLVLRRRRHRWD